mgnify:CR=1 FL=1
MTMDTQDAIRIVKRIEAKSNNAVSNSWIKICISEICQAIIREIQEYEESEGKRIAEGQE